jgi:hypothetical protein
LTFAGLYKINDGRNWTQGWAVGRYAEDVYNGVGTSRGNPWCVALSHLWIASQASPWGGRTGRHLMGHPDKDKGSPLGSYVHSQSPSNSTLQLVRSPHAVPSTFPILLHPFGPISSACPLKAETLYLSR